MVKPKLEVLGLIPARSGSKSVPDKNIRTLAGKPLLAHSIAHSLAAKSITRTIVSTDSAEYAAIARSYGAETPFLRPAEISEDLSSDLEVFQHCLEWLTENEGYRPDICVHLRPTYPFRRAEDIDRIVEILAGDESLDSVRTVGLAPNTPFKMWFRDGDGILNPALKSELAEPYNLPRQALPPVYLQNGCIDAVKTAVILEKGSMTGARIFGYLMEEIFDLDEEKDLEKAEINSLQQLMTEGRSLTFCFDIDGVAATVSPSLKYETAQPIRAIIEAINRLHDRGHYIIMFTARGSLTGRSWRELTRQQLNEWGVRFDGLIFGKPPADFYIDDKGISPGEIIRILKEIEHE